MDGGCAAWRAKLEPEFTGPFRREEGADVEPLTAQIVSKAIVGTKVAGDTECTERAIQDARRPSNLWNIPASKHFIGQKYQVLWWRLFARHREHAIIADGNIAGRCAIG